MHQDLLFKDLYVVEPGIVFRGHFDLKSLQYLNN